MLKTALLAVLLAVPAGAQSLYPDGWQPVPIAHFGGLNLLQDSSFIDGDAQIAVNVLTDNSFLELRPGNKLLSTILAGSPVQYVADWYAPNGSEYLIAQASQTVYETNFSGAPVALSTIAAGYNLTTIPQFSVLYFADGFRPLWYWNDSSTGTVTDATSSQVAPVCTVIDAKDSRIWCALTAAGFTEIGDVSSGGGQSTVLISSVGGAGYWAVPSDVNLVDDVPNRFDFNPDDGDHVICLAHTPWGEFVGKRNSSYMVKGNGNLSYNPIVLDPKIGCVDNRSVQMVYGHLEWLAVDGVYDYDGSGTPHLITRELDPLMQTIRETTFSQGTWLTALQPDWAAGTQSTTTGGLPSQGPWDFNTLPGEIFPSSGTLYDDNTSPNLQTCTTNLNPDSGLPWTCGVGFASDTLVNIDTTSVPLSIGYAQISPSSSGVNVWLSSFPANGGGLSECYTLNYTTWTVSAGGVQCSAPFGVVAIELNPEFGDMYTMAPSSGSTPSSNGWNYGFWSINTYQFINNNTYGSCDITVGSLCFEFDFIANNFPSTSWEGYGINVVQGLVAESAGSVGQQTLNLYKQTAGGIRSTLASYTYSYTESSSVVITTFSVTRTPGGYFTLWIGTSPVAHALDNTSGIQNAVMSSLHLVTNQDGNSGVLNVKLNGNGPGSILSRVFDTGTVSPLAGVINSSYTLTSDGATSITFNVRDSTSPNNDLWSSYQTVADAQLATLPLRYWQYEAIFNTTVASDTAQLGSIELDAVTTGYYYSRVDFVGNLITSWRQFGVDANTPGVYNYAVREATYSFPAGNTSIPWVTQSPNQNVDLSVSTPTYAQFRIDSTPLVSNPLGASAADDILSVALSWDQGADIPATSSTLERRYMLCVAISSSVAAPDTCLLRQKNGKWVEWSNGGTISAMGLYNYSMIAADGGTSSNIWSIMQPNVYDDDGNPINSQWVSAALTNNLPFNNKNYYGAMIDAQPVQFSSVTFGYAVSKSSTYVTTTFTIDDGQPLDASLPVNGSQYGDINQWVPPPAGFDVGKTVTVEFVSDAVDAYWRVNSYIVFVVNQMFTHP